jgi:hypothetical protein
MLLSERFKEFAMEGMSWYDMVSLHYWNPSKAFSILNSQDRGLFFTSQIKCLTQQNGHLQKHHGFLKE